MRKRPQPLKPAKAAPQKSRTRPIWNEAFSYVVLIVVLLIVRAVVIEATVVPTNSMENTILIGDHLYLDKILYGPSIPFTEYHLPAIKPYGRGDVIAFHYPVDPRIVFVKRLIGMPGDTIQIRQKQLYRNGQRVDEPYVIHKDSQTYPDENWVPQDLRIRDNFGPVTVPPHSYFAMGDNRDESLDSRYWGFVPEANMVGEPMFIHWSYDAPTEVWTATHLSDRLRDDWDILQHFFTKTRWSRIGTVIHNQPGQPDSSR